MCSCRRPVAGWSDSNTVVTRRARGCRSYDGEWNGGSSQPGDSCTKQAWQAAAAYPQASPTDESALRQSKILQPYLSVLLEDLHHLKPEAIIHFADALVKAELPQGVQIPVLV